LHVGGNKELVIGLKLGEKFC